MMPSRSWAVPAALVATLGSVLLAGCSSSPATTPSSSSSPSSTASVGPTAASPTSAEPKPSGTASVSPGPIFTPVPPVSRPGQSTPATRVDGSKGTFTTPVVYPDGVRVEIVSIAQKKVTDAGPGVILGVPYTVFKIRITNGSSAPIGLSNVVVTAAAGSPLRRVNPAYYSGVADFTGTAAPGKSLSASYGFSIPVTDLGSTTLIVDFDAVHSPAVFTGSAK